MVTAAKLVCSTWKITQPGERDGQTLYRNRFAPQPVHLLHTAGKRTDVCYGVGTGGSAEVCEEAAADGRSGRGNHGQYAAVSRCGGRSCGARRGGEHEPVPRDPTVGEENRSQRCANAGAVPVEKHAAGGAHEG